MIAILLALACGTERVAVKNLLDHPTLLPDRAMWVRELVTLPKPRWSPRAARHRVERQVVTVHAEVIAFKSEADGDLHVIIRDVDAPSLTPTSRALMIAELPALGCTRRSPYAAQMQKARTEFRRLMALGAQRIVLTGVVFFDKLHGQTGRAANGVELHPILFVGATP